MNECIQIIFSGVVALATVVYALLTWKLVSETKRLRELQTTPDIHVYFEIAETDISYVYLIIKNIGYGVAQNIRFKLIKDFQHYDSTKQELNTKGAIKNGIDNFYPNQKISYLFTDLSKNYNDKINDYIDLVINYEDINEKKYEKKIKLTLDEFSGTGKLSIPNSYIGRIAYELNEIKTLIKSEKK